MPVRLSLDPVSNRDITPRNLRHLTHPWAYWIRYAKRGIFRKTGGVAYLKKFLFTYEQRDTPVGSLSGGERARLQIALITLSGANFLILDEPTNHLDIPSCEVLEDALGEFNGTILAISHDRYFLDRIVGRVVEIENQKAVEYLGNYSDFENQRRSLKIKSP